MVGNMIISIGSKYIPSLTNGFPLNETNGNIEDIITKMMANGKSTLPP